MSTFTLKIIACITMFMDHIGYVIFDGTSYFNYIGRIAFPIFAFQIAQGYIHTKDIKKYFVRLLTFAIISELPFILFYQSISAGFAFNTIFTLLFGLISIIFYSKTNKSLGIFITFLLGIFAEFFKFDYGFYGVSIVLLFYIFQNRKILMLSSFTLATIIKYLYHTLIYIDYGSEIILRAFIYYFPLCLFTVLSSVFIYFYNGQKGRDLKHFLYWFYPLHLIFIYVLSFIL